MTIFVFLNGYIFSAGIEFHGFSFASENIYSAIFFAQVIFINGPASAPLIIAKKRVAPIKVISLPKLELCGTLLLAKMLHNLIIQLKLTQHQMRF